MVSTKYQLARLRIIDRELQRKRRVKTKDLIKTIKYELNIPVSSRAIQKDINLMRYDSTLNYDAPIEYDNKEKAWYYSNPNYTITAFRLKEDEVKSLSFYARILGAYRESGIFSHFSNAIEKVLDAVKIQEFSKENQNVNSLIQVDQQPPYSGGEFIPKIITALQEKRLIKFQYQKFDDAEPKERLIHPYLLKVFGNRWYLIGIVKNKEKITTYGLDRIRVLSITDEYFKRKEIDFDKYYKYSLGITVMENEPVEVILSFTAMQGKYIKTLPFHSTQSVLIDSEKEFRISVTIKPAFEFYAKILSYGVAVRVVSPESIVKEVKNRLKDTLKFYSK